jgi:hypothetical protein
MSNDIKSVREKIMGILLSQCGRVDEEIVGTGLVEPMRHGVPRVRYRLAVNFQEVVHLVGTEEAEVSKLQ